MNRQTVIIIIFLVAVALGIGLVLPQYQTLKLLQTEINERQNELQSKEQYLADLRKASDTLKEYKTQIAKINSILPSDPDLPALFDFMQNASSQSGLILKGVSPSNSRVSQQFEGIQETDLSLMLSGSYSSFKNFLSVLEQTARLIEIKSVSFVSPETEAPFTFNLKATVYSY